MRKIWISICIFVIAIGICIAEILSVNHMILYLGETIASAQEAVKAQNMDLAIQYSDTLKTTWASNHQTLSLFIEHGRLEEIDQSVTASHIYLAQNQTDEFFVESGMLLSQLDQLKETEIPHIGNII